MKDIANLEGGSILLLLAVTLLFVLLNGFFVASEFALVKVRSARIAMLADRGNRRAGTVRTMLGKMDLFLSSCQFGITVSSLILGWLAEPAVANLLILGAKALGWPVGQSAVLHAVALALALTIVTMLHMTLGEQAPKILAIHRAEKTSLLTAYPLRVFTWVFKPLIWVINRISNGIIRLGGVSPQDQHDATLDAEELRAVLAASAQAGHISARQREFAENVIGFINIQVRHILVPRVEVVSLSTRQPLADNLRTIRESKHSRFPLCEMDLDTVMGIVHAKDVLTAVSRGEAFELRALAREPVFIPDTQPLGRMIVELQRARTKSAIVLDDHGTAIGMAFFEDVLEEIVGPILDEFDVDEPTAQKVGPGVYDLPGSLSFPEAKALLDIDEVGLDDTIGGQVVSLLKRLPQEGDTLTMGNYNVTVTEVTRRRVTRLRFEEISRDEED